MSEILKALKRKWGILLPRGVIVYEDDSWVRIQKPSGNVVSFPKPALYLQDNVGEAGQLANLGETLRRNIQESPTGEFLGFRGVRETDLEQVIKVTRKSMEAARRFGDVSLTAQAYYPTTEEGSILVANNPVTGECFVVEYHHGEHGQRVLDRLATLPYNDVTGEATIVRSFFSGDDSRLGDSQEESQFGRPPEGRSTRLLTSGR